MCLRFIFCIFFSFFHSQLFAQSILLEGNLDEWSLQIINGQTRYEPVMDMEQGVVIRAESLNAASAYRYSHTIDLEKTAILKWQWTAEVLPFYIKINESGIEQKIHMFNEKNTQADDFVLRVSVGRTSIFDDEKVLHYVWSNSEPIGSHWALDANTRVLVVSGEEQTIMKWQTILRDVAHDWSNVFDEKITEIDFVSFMTDSENIHGHAVGYYGDMGLLRGKALLAKE